MSSNWTQEQIAVASEAMHRMGEMTYEEFCTELDRARAVTYTYYMRQIHTEPTSLPSGVIRITPWNSRPYTPAIGGCCFGKVEFARKLTAQEMAVFGLVPV